MKSETDAGDWIRCPACRSENTGMEYRNRQLVVWCKNPDCHKTDSATIGKSIKQAKEELEKFREKLGKET